MKNESLRVVDFKFRTFHAKDKIPTKTDHPPPNLQCTIP